jgi:hypothetical protein
VAVQPKGCYLPSGKKKIATTEVLGSPIFHLEGKKLKERLFVHLLLDGVSRALIRSMWWVPTRNNYLSSASSGLSQAGSAKRFFAHFASIDQILSIDAMMVDSVCS